MFWSPDSRLVAVLDVVAGQVGVWDAGSGALVRATEICREFVLSALFTVDGSELVYSCWDDGRLVSVSTETWEVTRQTELAQSVVDRDRMYLVGYGPDSSTLVAVGQAFGSGGGSLHWLDADSLQPFHTIAEIHVGSPKAFAFSPDRSLLATGSSDGFVKVWDLIERRLYQEFYVGPTQVQGVAFIDDFHLLVAPQIGGLVVYTLDPEELLSLVRGSLTRGFTPAECDRYGFGDDCPSLEELRGEPGSP